MYSVVSLIGSDQVGAKVEPNGTTLVIGELWGTIEGYRHEMRLPLTELLMANLMDIVSRFPNKPEPVAQDQADVLDKRHALVTKPEG